MRLPSMSRTEWLVVAVILTVLVVIVADSTETRRRQWHCCALCRLVKIDYQNIFGRRWTEIEETECSKWYAQNVEPEHEHLEPAVPAHRSPARLHEQTLGPRPHRRRGSVAPPDPNGRGHRPGATIRGCPRC